MKIVSSLHIFILWIFTVSCSENKSTNISCREVVSRCNKLVSQSDKDRRSLDTALQIIDASSYCDSLKRYLVDLKIRILMTKGFYSDCIKYVDSLPDTDFYFPYKKSLMHRYLIARQVQSVDTIRYATELQKVTNGLETYIATSKLENSELQEALFDLYSLKKQFADSSVIRSEIDSLSLVYPSQADFLKFLY